MKAPRARPRDPAGHLPVFGHETEYQVTFFAADGSAAARLGHSGRAVRAFARTAVHLPGRDAFDLYLGNGGRFYRDSGLGLCNVEYATPECATPEEIVAHVHAGDCIARRAVDAHVEGDETLASACVSKASVDYQGHTNGAHENHLHCLDPLHLGRQLMPLLASRVVISGGGGFDDTSPGLAFSCSSRVPHLEHASSRGAQHSRGIYTIKDEPLAAPGYHRLQLLSSEGVRCEASERLRFTPVALTVRAIAAGATPGDAVRLEDPLAAINAFARDPALGAGRVAATARLASGETTTALDLQRHYIAVVEAYLGAPGMPAWAETSWRAWRDVVEELSADPERLVGILDWPTKLALYRAHCERRGVAWETLARWSRALRTLARGAGAGQAAGTPRLGRWLHARGPARSRVVEALAAEGLSVADLPRFATLRDELFEVDIRFGEVGPDSLFDALVREGVIVPGTVDASAVARAALEPPPGGRAALRGAWIAHLHDRRSTHACDWTGIHHVKSGKKVDLSDPFGAGAAPPPGREHEHGRQAGETAV